MSGFLGRLLGLLVLARASQLAFTTAGGCQLPFRIEGFFSLRPRRTASTMAAHSIDLQCFVQAASEPLRAMASRGGRRESAPVGP